MYKKAVVLASLLMTQQIFSQESPTTFIITPHGEGFPIAIKVKTMDSCYFNVFVNNTLIFDTIIGSRGYNSNSTWGDSLMRITPIYPCGLGYSEAVVRVKEWKVRDTKLYSLNLTSNPFRVRTFCTVGTLKTLHNVKESKVCERKFLLNGREFKKNKHIKSPYIRR